MQEEQHTNEEIEKILNSWDGMHRAEPAPYFFTRLEARIQATHTGKNIFAFILRPAVSLTALLVLLLLNVGMITYTANTKWQRQQPGNSNGLQELASEMNHDISSVYNDKTNP